MLEGTSRQVIEALCAETGEGSIAAGPPEPHDEADGLLLTFLHLAPAAPQADRSASTTCFYIEYLLCARAAASASAQGLIDRALDAIIRHPDLELTLAPFNAQLWLALGVVPRPALFFRVPVIHTLAQRRGPPVREQPEVSVGALLAFEGRILDPAGHALAHCDVSLPLLGLSARSDQQGRFLFPGVPAQPARQALRVDYRGRVQEQEINLNSRPLIIEFTAGVA